MMQRIVVRLGEFNTCILFLCVIWKLFKDLGLADILLEAGTVAQGSLPSVMKGRHYNQSVKIIKIMAEALRKKLLSIFMDTQREEEKDKFLALSKSLCYAFPKTQFQHFFTFNDFKGFERKLSLFVQERCSQFPTFVFWMSYLNMADLSLNFIRAKQIGDWALHLQSVVKMVPRYFAYDHLNYAKYLPEYIYEIVAIPDKHLSITDYLAARDFVV